MTGNVNGDLTAFCAVDTGGMQWRASPSGTVWRKRVHLVGSAESGQVTSVVRYDSNSSFPEHDHPQGEEILVLEGLFQDEYGEYPAGSWLRNPRWSRHAPFTGPEGALIYVKTGHLGADFVASTQPSGRRAPDDK